MSGSLARIETPRHATLCAHALRQAERAPKALAQSEAICRANGARLTPIRRRVLEAMYATHRPLGAYELAEVLAPAGERLAPITVYRALEFLIEQGLARRLTTKNAYVASLSGGDPREVVALLICDDCGGVDEATAQTLTDDVANLLSDEGFRPTAKVLEITGQCTHCRVQAN